MNPIIGALAYNREKIIEMIDRARKQRAELVIFSEMALCGYPPQDLLLLPAFIEAMEQELDKVREACYEIAAIVGSVRVNSNRGEKGLFNTAALIENGKIIGFQDKTLLPDYDVFSERRYFDAAHEVHVWNLCGKRVAVTICEDIWQHSGAVEYATYQMDPVLELKGEKPDFLVNLSASPFQEKRHETRLHVCQAVASYLNCPVLYCNQVGGNDSLIFDGYSLYVDRHQQLLQYGKGFEEDLLIVDLDKTYPPSTVAIQPVEDLFQALVLGVRDYFHKLGFSKACFGLSGGIDSAVVACIAVEALGRENILALSLPSRYTSAQSCEDAEKVAKNLKIRLEKISIDALFQLYLETLAPYFKETEQDHTEENLQARIRGMILMAFSNKFGYLTLGTGNKSEMAMGYSTLYGDMCGGLGVLGDVTKQQVYALARWINRKQEIIPQSTLTKAPSAELAKNQKDSDTLPEYFIIDTVLKEYVEEHHSPQKIAQMSSFSLPLAKDLVRRIHINEYKRQQAPPVLRVTKKAFTVGRRFPIVQRWNQ